MHDQACIHDTCSSSVPRAQADLPNRQEGIGAHCLSTDSTQRPTQSSDFLDLRK